MPWFKCKKCGNLFISPEEVSVKNKKKLPKCPKCNAEDIENDDLYNRG